MVTEYIECAGKKFRIELTDAGRIAGLHLVDEAAVRQEKGTLEKRNPPFPDQKKEYERLIRKRIEEIKIRLRATLEDGADTVPEPLDASEFDLQGTPFQKAIWNLIREIPYGATCSYKDLAEAYCEQNGKLRMSAQAVGQAVRKNPVMILIPCHRVIAHNGKIGGYNEGIDLKIFLLENEADTIRRLNSLQSGDPASEKQSPSYPDRHTIEKSGTNT